jgi:hypothetical protein
MGMPDLRSQAPVHRGLSTNHGEEGGHPVHPNSLEAHVA